MRAPRPACLSTTLSMVAARCRSINSAWSPIGPVRALDGLAGGAELLRTGAVLGREWAAVLARRRLLRRWHRDSARRGGRVVRLGKSTRLNSSHVKISYAVFCLKKKKKTLYSNYVRKVEKRRRK